MTKPRRKIIIMEGDRVIEERDDQRMSIPQTFGLTTADWIKFVVYVIILTAMWVEMRSELKQIREDVRRLTALSEQFTKYVQNSDNWHSTVLGTQFNMGKPSDSFDPTRVRNNLYRTN